MSLGLISSSSDLTPEWLTELLRSTGDLDDGATVSTVEATAFGSAESMMSSLFRLHLSYDGETEAPESLIVKLASPNEMSLFVADMFRFYEREIRFYRELADVVEIATPRCFLSEMYPDNQGFIIVLEEVTGCRAVDQLDGLSFDDAVTALEAVADLHAPFFGTDLTPFENTMLPFGSELMHQLVPGKVIGDWQASRDEASNYLDSEVVALLDRWDEFFAASMTDMMGDNTITHGDLRADNLLYQPDGTVLILDFQLMTVCNGMADVAYVVSQSLAPDAQERATELIDAYVARLGAKGIAVDLELGMKAYRASLLFFLSIPLSMLVTEGLHDRSRELARVMLERASKEILRTGAHELY